ncbi:type VI secretion system lipoprotein TssJ [Thalassobius sp. S69A]|uniref:type VI secretion system lipoprotein TssJ n=1 Tax=unclassified Thalassovita TaxID=2619711 RepID=UPI000C0DE556|nr:type VI secretion system lipoprotein TssJ [Paracoccaceae bacterium]MBT25697.1 type VI secretion system lipoprotein TssJ [Paracoccaceae bacterium]
MLTKRAFLGLAAAALLAACAGPSDTSVQLTLTGAADMNGGAPAQAKVYYLADSSVFASADFFAVFNDPQATLGTDLIEVKTYQLSPGRTIADTASFPAGAPAPKAIGIVGAFRNINGRFLAVRPLSPNASNPVQASLSGNSVTLR